MPTSEARVVAGRARRVALRGTLAFARRLA
jgi:hypothetical protein